MAFFILKPEDAGNRQPEPGSEAPLCVFDTWLGDDLVRALQPHPLLLVTAALKSSLETLDAPTGFRFGPARVERSLFFRAQRPRLQLPVFWELQVEGQAGRDDMGITADHSLVVSQRALYLLVKHCIRQAQLAQYAVEGKAWTRMS
jgi:hypothetical protein